MSGKALMELDPQETRELLGTARVGHLAYHSSRGLDIAPVNYSLGEDVIYIRTVVEGTLAALARDHQEVAFLVTYFDRLSQTGWSVKVRGTVTGVDEDVEVPDFEPKPWPGMPSTVLLRLPIEEITGRRVT